MRDCSDRVDRPNGVKKMKKDKLFQQRKMKKVLTESEHPDFEIDSVFDLNYKEGKEIKMAKKKKDKGDEETTQPATAEPEGDNDTPAKI